MEIKVEPIKLEKVVLDRELSLNFPVYSNKDVPNLYCARYARLSTKFMFGNVFPLADAWKMRNQKGVQTCKVNETIFQKESKFNVRPGSLVGIYTPDSRYLDKPLIYTHLSLYLGKKKDNPLFLEQFVDEIRLITLNEYQKYGLEIKEILSPMTVVPNKQVL